MGKDPQTYGCEIQNKPLFVDRRDPKFRLILLCMVLVCGSLIVSRPYTLSKDGGKQNRIKFLYYATQKMDPDILMRLKCYVHDLLTFDKEAQKRLETNYAPYYLSSAYFLKEEVELILSFRIDLRTTFQDRLDAQLKSLPDFQICTSHGLAPLFQETFHIQKGFQNERAYKKYRKKFVKTTRL